jgi:hypothetical protein
MRGKAFEVLKRLDPAREVAQWPPRPVPSWSALAADQEASPLAAPRSRRPRRVLLAASLTGVVAAIGGVVAVQVTGPQTPASAATPPPLRLQYPTDAGPADKALTAMADELQAGPPQQIPTGTFSFVRVAQWSLDMTSGDDATQVAIVPQLTELWRAADGSGKISKVTLDAQDVATPPDAAALNTLAAQRVPQVETYPAGGLASVVPDPLPRTVEGLEKVLYAHQPRVNGPKSAVRAVADLYRDSAVDLDVRIAALRVLAGTKGVLYRGVVTDRLGRSGIAVSVDSDNGGTRDLLVFDPRTGLLLGYESMFLRRPANLPVRVPAVFSYVLYLDQDRRPSAS